MDGILVAGAQNPLEKVAIFVKMERKLYYFHKDIGLEIDFIIILPPYMAFLLRES